MSDPRRQLVADLLRRFNHPRSYAGDYYATFADRILDALDEYEDERVVERIARALCAADGKVSWTESIPAVYYDQARDSLAGWRNE